MESTYFGGYELLDSIGSGGMAEVFRARVRGQAGFSKLVAIKRIRSRFMDDRVFVDMFIDEAKVAVQLNHANIAKIFDLGRVDGQLFIAMEHVHGRDLKTVFDQQVKTCGPVPIPQVCYIGMKLCEGLDYAHSRRNLRGESLQVVHRDVSLHNVLLSFDGEVKIIDFGVVKAEGRVTKTQKGTVKGKLTYMSPEQLRGLPVDCRSDVFSAGIVLYELLTGRRLFLTKSARETVRKIRDAKVVPLRTFNQRIPAALEAIVLKALSRHRDDRYQTAGELQAALQHFAFTRRQTCSRAAVSNWLRAQFSEQFTEESARLRAFAAIEPTPPPTTLPIEPDASEATISVDVEFTDIVEATQRGWCPAASG